MAKYSINDLIIDRVDKIVFQDLDGNVVGGLNDVQNFSISNSSETKDKTDSTGALIKRFYQAKSASFSGENATFNLGLAALQFGNPVEYATTSDPITMPYIYQVTVASGTTTVTLPHTPVTGTVAICDTDSSLLPDLETTYTQATTADETHFAVSGTTLTVPVGYTGILQIKYDRNVEEGARASNSSDKFPTTTRMTVSIIGCTKCRPDELIHYYIVFPSAQLSSDFDLGVSTDSVHNFSGTAQVDSCSTDKLLYYIDVPTDDEDEVA